MLEYAETQGEFFPLVVLTRSCDLGSIILSTDRKNPQRELSSLLLPKDLDILCIFADYHLNNALWITVYRVGVKTALC